MNGLDFTAISKLKLLIKSKNLKKRENRRTSIRFYGKSVLLIVNKIFTIEIVAQFCMKLKKKIIIIL